jgi:uncharacterized protein (TIGR03435 family)
MRGLVNLTSNVLDTPVIDGTGIEGFYDFSLDPVQYVSTKADGNPELGTRYADLFETALREQLGLRRVQAD